jgi:hypothetical protein
MGEVVAVRCQALDRRLAGAQHPSVVGVGRRTVRILNDLAGDLSVDRSTKPVRADSLLFRLLPPGAVRLALSSIPLPYEARNAETINSALSRFPVRWTRRQVGRARPGPENVRAYSQRSELVSVSRRTTMWRSSSFGSSSG